MEYPLEMNQLINILFAFYRTSFKSNAINLINDSYRVLKKEVSCAYQFLIWSMLFPLSRWEKREGFKLFLFR